MSVSDERLQRARTVADAVLYEGYLLYPYRASSAKNRSRWQFGVLGPPGAADRGLGEPDSMSMTTLLTGVTQASRLLVRLRFLQLQQRQIRDTDGRDVAALDLGDHTELTWDEAVAQTAAAVASGETIEPLVGPDGTALGSVVRRRWGLRAVVGSTSTRHGPWTLLTVTVRNDHPERPSTPDDATRTSLLGAHLLVEAEGCAFKSMVDPPADVKPIVDGCRQDRCWPFLAGVDGESDLLLGSPIILYDHPEVAPESTGALFDATEIDEILTLRVLTMTEAEKAEARATDPRAAAIIDRCEAMTPADLQQLHGIFRDPRGPLGGPVGPRTVAGDGDGAGDGTGEETGELPWWDPGTDASVDPGSDAVLVRGVPVRKGSLVRVHPSRRADAQDLFFADQVARVTAVLSDVDGGTHVALVLEDDPAADLHDWYGRYFYFAPDELEPLDTSGEEG
jgi:hypothetical protein